MRRRDKRNCVVAKDLESGMDPTGSAACAGASRETALLQRTSSRGVGPTPTCRAAGASGLFSSRRPVRGGGAGVDVSSHRHPIGCALCCVEGSSHPLCKRGVWYGGRARRRASRNAPLVWDGPIGRVGPAERNGAGCEGPQVGERGTVRWFVMSPAARQQKRRVGVGRSDKSGWGPPRETARAAK